MQILPEALQPLAAFKQFILWSVAIRNGVETKIPNPHLAGKLARNAHNPDTWMSVEQAIQAAATLGDAFKVGFVFTEQDPFFFLDIDHCLQADGSWSPLAMSLCEQFKGAAVEISQSGDGLHIFGRAAQTPHSNKNIAHGIELYTSGRFVALTGDRAVGSADTDCTVPFQNTVNTYFTPAPVAAVNWTDEPHEDWHGTEDNTALIKKALNSSSAGAVFGGRATFKALWEADEEPLSISYPDQSQNRMYDSSSADAALAQHLAFWTGGDCERMLALMWVSGLVREKWSREDYLVRTITKACSMQNVYYNDGMKVTLESAPAPLNSAGVSDSTSVLDVAEPIVTSGYQYLGATFQIEYFKGCCYVQDIHRVFTPNGSLLKSEQFNATYGGYVFQIDETGKKPTRKAWEAFTESQLVRYPKAESMCFRPELTPGALVREEGRVLVNTYVPIKTPRMEGDVSRFTNHVSKLLPAEHDRAIILAYMAAVIQYPGVKFQWSPLIQGAEGNGKTLLTRCVAFAVGQRYTHIPPVNEISEKFNEWLFYKLFIGIEDVYVPEHKREVIEILKPMITNDRLSMRAMQQGQVMGDNRANFMLNSNHKNAIQHTRNDRRFAVFFTNQQHEDDLKRDGMDGAYFPDLYDWLKNQNGYAMVAQYLESYSIPDALNPATHCHRAPVTTSTNEAITASLGSVEQEVIEAIDEGRQGFAGGWVSSMALERLLRDMRMERAVPHNKRRDMLNVLGYDWHPTLRDGRVNNPIMIDGGKPRLFIREGNLALQITNAADVVKAYVQAQPLSGGAVDSVVKGERI